MPKHGRRIPDESGGGDADLWRQYTSGVKPLKPPRDLPVDVPPPAPPASEPPSGQPVERRPVAGAAAATVAPPRPAASPPSLAPGTAAGLDQRTLMRLRRGQIRPETQIDLHRLTQSEAHAALLRFLAAAQLAGRRCVLVITGKGYGTDGAVGVLKSNVPRWMNESPTRERVLAFAHATGRDGGEGALYVLLRRLRTADSAPAGPAHRR